MRIRHTKKLKYKQKLSQAYKINMIALGCGALVLLCLLTFWVRIFEKWDTATVIVVEHGSNLAQIITYVVDGEKFVCSYPSYSNGQGKNFSPGDRIEYLVSNPSVVFPRRLLPLIFISAFFLLTSAVMVVITLQERKTRTKNEWYYYDDIK